MPLQCSALLLLALPAVGTTAGQHTQRTSVNQLPDMAVAIGAIHA